jgi:hypothetical protein
MTDFRPESPTAGDHVRRVLLIAIVLGIVGYIGWAMYRFNADLRDHGAEFKGLLDHGQGFANRWLADLSADPDIAYQATTAAFRERVSADEWKGFVAAHPELRNPATVAKMVSVGGGSVGFNPFSGRQVVPSTGLYRTDPGGVEVVVVYEGEALRVDRVRAKDTALPAD